MKRCKKEPHRIYLTTEENQSQSAKKLFLFLCEVVASKVWCYIQAIACGGVAATVPWPPLRP